MNKETILKKTADNHRTSTMAFAALESKLNTEGKVH